MKPQEIKDLYPVPPDVHESLCRTLSDLDDTAQVRYKKRRRVRRFITAFAAITVLAAFTTAAYATDFFGLSTEHVGKYGLNMNIEEDAERFNGEKKHVKPIIGYIPEGCKLVDSSAQSGKYRYTTDGKEYGAELTVGFYLTDASDYNNEERYIVESEEREINGHKAIIGAQQLEENGEKYYFGVMYFENRGYAAHFNSNNRTELLKFMQGLDLEEDVDYTEPPTTKKENYHVPEDDYAFKMREDYRFVEVGEPFGYTEWIYYEDGEKKPDAFTVTVKSIEERDSSDGLDKQGFMYGERFSEWFDEDNKLISPYIRRDYDFGDDEGLYELITHTDTQTDRHFFVATVELTANADTETDDVPITAWATPIIRENGDHYDYPTGCGQAFLIYQPTGDQMPVYWKKGTARTYTYGILVDDEVLDQSCIEFITKRYEIDHRAETVENINENICIMLRGGAKK